MRFDIMLNIILLTLVFLINYCVVDLILHLHSPKYSGVGIVITYEKCRECVSTK